MRVCIYIYIYDHRDAWVEIPDPYHLANPAHSLSLSTLEKQNYGSALYTPPTPYPPPVARHSSLTDVPSPKLMSGTQGQRSDA